LRLTWQGGKINLGKSTLGRLGKRDPRSIERSEGTLSFEDRETSKGEKTRVGDETERRNAERKRVGGGPTRDPSGESRGRTLRTGSLMGKSMHSSRGVNPDVLVGGREEFLGKGGSS